MKLNFEYSEEEKRSILEQHYQFKKVLQSKVKRLMINEQVKDGNGVTPTISGKDLLDAAMTKNCKITRGGELYSDKGELNNEVVIFKVADEDSPQGYYKKGDKLYIKGDYTFDVVKTDNLGNETTIEGNPWQCPELTADAVAAIAKTKKDADDAALKNFELTQKEGAWKERKDIMDTDDNVENPQMYEKKVVNGVILYRRVSGKGIAGATDARQQAVINKWSARGAKLEKDVDAEEAKTWERYLVSPKSEGLFSEDFYMYFPPTTITNTDITTSFEGAVKEQTPESPKDCKQAVESYYEAFKRELTFQPNVFYPMKKKVQLCKNTYYNKWGAFRGGKKLDEYLDILDRTLPGGPSTAGDDSVWLLNRIKK